MFARPALGTFRLLPLLPAEDEQGMRQVLSDMLERVYHVFKVMHIPVCKQKNAGQAKVALVSDRDCVIGSGINTKAKDEC